MFGTTRLRTKFLLSFLTVTSCLTAATLLVVRYQVEKGMRAAIGARLLDSVKTYRMFASQRDAARARSSAQLANLPNVRAVMSTQDPRTIQEEANSILALSGSDLLVLGDKAGQLEGLESRGKAITRGQAATLLRASLEHGEDSAWWSGGGRLYEVWLQPIYFGKPERDSVVGIVALGHELDAAAARDFARVVSGDVVFREGEHTVASTLPPWENNALQQLELRPNEGDTPREVRIGEERYLATTVMLSTNAVSVTLTVLQSLDKATEFLRGLNRILLGLGLMGVLTAGMLVFLISRTFTLPLERLVAGARALEHGDYNYTLTARGRDEVGEVTLAFERMRRSLQSTQAEQKQLEDRLRQAHKMEAVGRLAGGVAHDFNNLLTVIRGNSELLSEQCGSDARQHKYVEQIQKAGDRAVSMTRQLLAFSRMQVLQPKVLDLNAVISEMNKIIPRLIGEHIEFQFHGGTALAAVLADPGQLEQVFMNLAVNARDAMPNGGTLRVETRNAIINDVEARKRPPMQTGEYVLLRVTDTGYGMDPDTKARIFEPFFTTKPAGKGTGLGLATVYGIVKQSNGFIWVESEVGCGTSFEIYLPACSRNEEKAAEHLLAQIPGGGKETILLVEDETGVRELACIYLQAAGYTVLLAEDGESALNIAANRMNQIHLVLTDMIMPKMNGNRLADELKKIRPELKVLYMTGYAEFPSSQLEQQFGGANLLQKPFSRAALLRKVIETLTRDEKDPVPNGRA